VIHPNKKHPTQKNTKLGYTSNRTKEKKKEKKEIVKNNKCEAYIQKKANLL